jgi:AcrR family transcriptional regulator
MIAVVKRLNYNCPMNKPTRTYTLRKRAQASEETRQRIIEAARELFSREGYHSVSLDEIASYAGVSRQTLYVQFNSKRGLLQELVAHLERESYGSTNIIEGARRSSDPEGTIRRGVSQQLALFNRNAGLLRTFHAEANSDPDFRAVWQNGLDQRREAIYLLVVRIADATGIREGWSVEEATDWLWSLTSFQRYDELVLQRGWTPAQLAVRLVEAIDMVLKPR